MEEGLRIDLLGPLVASRNGTEVVIGGRRQRRLLAALTTFDSVASADRLVDAVWAEEDLPADPRASLRTCLTRLRNAIGSDALETYAEGWQLNKRITTDARDFREALAHASRLDLAAHARLAAIDEALALWRGDAYSEFRHEAWAQPVATHLEELRVGALESRYELMLEVGMHADAIPGLVAASQANPLRDRLVGLQMLALYRSGRQAEAGRVFAGHRRRLLEDVGLEPGPELTDLDRRIMAGEPTLHLTTVPGQQLRGYRLGEVVGEGAHSIVYRGTQPFLGRDVAVKLIRPALADEPSFIRRFESEAQLVSQLEHPHIVPLYDYWREPGRACLVFRFLRPGSLDRLLTDPARPSLDEEQIIRLVFQIGGALGSAHRSGVLHQDVKPSNIFLDESHNFYLGDFGVARSNQPGTDGRRGLPAGVDPFSEATDIHTDIRGLAFTLESAVSHMAENPPRAVADMLSRAATDAQHWISVDALVEDVAGALRAHAGPGKRRPTSAVTSTPPNPYVGLRAFTEAEVGAFHGREELVDVLLDHLCRDDGAGRLLVIVGPSGIGKSSLMKAGLLPKVRSGAIPGSENWFVATMTPGRDPYEELAVALLRVADRVPDNLMSHLREDASGIARVIRSLLPPTVELLLVVDQFEELFTGHSSRETVRGFLTALAAVIEDESCPVRLVLGMRADFWHRPLQHARFGALLQPSAISVPALTPDQLERAVTGPAHTAGVEYAPGVVSEIISEVASQPGGLPLLQYALTEMWEHQVSRLITHDAYREIGGVSGALTAQAERLVAACSETEYRQLRQIFGRLVSVEDGNDVARRRALLSELGRSDETTSVLVKLDESRLVTFDRDPATREPTVEVAHEALLAEWPRLGEWIEEDRDGIRLARHLTRQAVAWIESGRDDGELYRGGRLEAVETWASNSATLLDGEEQEFLDASIAAREAAINEEREQLAVERRTNRKLRVVTVSVAIAAALALLSSVVAVSQRSSARAAAADAETGRLVAQSTSFADSNSRLAALLAVAAYRRDPTPATLGAIQEALVGAAPLIGVHGQGRAYIDVELLPSGRMVGVRSDGLDLFDRGDPEPIDTLDLDVGRVTSFFTALDNRHRVAAATETDRLVVVDREGTVRVLDADERFVEIARQSIEAVPGTVAIDPAGERFLVAGVDGTMEGYSIDGNRLFERQYVLADNLAVQSEPVIGEIESSSLRDILEDIPVRVRAMPVASDLYVEVGSFVRRLSWDGEVVAGPTLPVATFGGARLPPHPSLISLVAEDGSLQVITRNSIFELPSSTDWPETVAVDAYQAFFGAGTPYIAGVTTTDEGSSDLVIGTTDGQVAEFDAATGEFGTSVYTVPALTNAVAFRSSQAALATDDGISLISLLGEGPLSTGFRRAPDQPSATISKDGDLVYVGPGGAPGSIAVFRADGSSASEFKQRPVGSPFAGGFITSTLQSLTVWYAVGDGSHELDSYLVEDGKLRFERTIRDPPGGRASDVTTDLMALAADRPAITDRTTGQLLRKLPEPLEPTDVTFHPTEDLFLASSLSGHAVLYDTTTWQPVSEVDLSDEKISVANWSQDGTLVASADFGGSVVVRDGVTFEPIRAIDSPTLGAETWNESALIFSADNRFLLTNIDGEGQLWDIATGERIGRAFPNHPLGNSGVNWGEVPQLVTTTANSALLWNLDVDSWPEQACRVAGSELTEQEWEQWGPRDEPYHSLC